MKQIIDTINGSSAGSWCWFRTVQKDDLVDSDIFGWIQILQTDIKNNSSKRLFKYTTECSTAFISPFPIKLFSVNLSHASDVLEYFLY